MTEFDRFDAGYRLFGTRRRGDAEGCARRGAAVAGCARNRDDRNDLRGSAAPREPFRRRILEVGTL